MWELLSRTFWLLNPTGNCNSTVHIVGFPTSLIIYIYIYIYI
ncbi:MAG: hypothetical protein N7Q72_05895 [Spiroplasma sp. Tabriz.8]|nr:hypothetical protein [Spiroplasma sp. Tabriz.8]